MCFLFLLILFVIYVLVLDVGDNFCFFSFKNFWSISVFYVPYLRTYSLYTGILCPIRKDSELQVLRITFNWCWLTGSKKLCFIKKQIYNFTNNITWPLKKVFNYMYNLYRPHTSYILLGTWSPRITKLSSLRSLQWVQK